MTLSDDIISLLKKQGFVIVSTLDKDGKIHCSAKGVVGVEPEGKVFVVDLYVHRTFNNLKRDPRVSITAINERSFRGYTLQGIGKIVPRAAIEEHLMRAWEDKVISRISTRLITSVQAKAKSKGQFEAELPHPKYLIEIDVEDIIDLSPPSMRKRRS